MRRGNETLLSQESDLGRCLPSTTTALLQYLTGTPEPACQCVPGLTAADFQVGLCITESLRQVSEFPLLVPLSWVLVLLVVAERLALDVHLLTNFRD